MKDDEKLPEFTVGPSTRRLYWQEIDPVFGVPRGFVTGVECYLADLRAVLEALTPEQLAELRGYSRLLAHVNRDVYDDMCAKADRLDAVESDLALVREELEVEVRAHRCAHVEWLKQDSAAQKRIAELEWLIEMSPLEEQELIDALRSRLDDETREVARLASMTELTAKHLLRIGATSGSMADRAETAADIHEALRTRLEWMEAVVEAARAVRAHYCDYPPYMSSVRQVCEAVDALDSASAPQAAEPEPPKPHSECVAAALQAVSDAFVAVGYPNVERTIVRALRERAAELRGSK